MTESEKQEDENFVDDLTRSGDVPDMPTTEASGAVESEVAEAAAEATAEVTDAGKRAEELEDKLLRVQAEFDNYRKRMQREKEEALRYAAGSIIEELLPVLDNFEMGLMAARQASGEGVSAIVTGFEMVATQLNRFFEDQGVEVINAEGQPFDHNLHEALGQEESTEVEEGIVLRQTRRGYKLRDRLLRPASVYVAAAPSDGTNATEGAGSSGV